MVKEGPDRAQMSTVNNIIIYYFINCSFMQMKIPSGVKKEKRNNKMQMSCFDYSEYTRTDIHDKVPVIKICKEENWCADGTIRKL